MAHNAIHIVIIVQIFSTRYRVKGAKMIDNTSTTIKQLHIVGGW